MVGSPFRFLHAGEFHLDQPLGGLTVLPEDLVDPLIDAPYKAVDRVIDAALRERVDFVVLTGDVIHFPTATPRASEFLRAQFQRLQAEKIPVYWLGGRLEAGHPPLDELDLPPNVHLLGSDSVERLEVKRGKETIAYVVGQSASDHLFPSLDDMRCPRDGRFFAGLWYGKVDEHTESEHLDELGIDYWAFGGGHNPRRLAATIPAHYSGTPQPRLPSEVGAHGCVLVKVEGSDVQTDFIETDVIRYRTERLELSSTDEQQRLLELASDRLQRLRNELDAERAAHQHLLVTWEVLADGRLGRELRSADGGERMLTQLKHQLREQAGPNIWSIGLRCLRASVPANLFDEDTILGDFLREVRDMEQRGDGILDVRAYVPDTPAADKLAESLHLEDLAAQRQLLRDVATIGIDMLSGD